MLLLRRRDRAAALGRGDGRRPARLRRRRLATGRAQAPVEQRHGGPHGQRHRGRGGRGDRAADAVRRRGGRLHASSRGTTSAGPQMQVHVPQRPTRPGRIGEFRDTEGVQQGHRAGRGLSRRPAQRPGHLRPDHRRRLRVAARGGHAALLPRRRRLRREGRRVRQRHDQLAKRRAGPCGPTRRTTTARSGREIPWTVPQDMPAGPVRARTPPGTSAAASCSRPSALPEKLAASALRRQLYLELDRSVPDVQEHVRNTAARLDPAAAAHDLAHHRDATTATPPSAPACSSAPPACWR